MRNLRLPLLAAPLLLGTALAASAAPHARHAKAKPVPPVTAAPAPQAAPSGPFRDVPPNHWAAQAVETLRQKGIVRGYPSGAYRTPPTTGKAR